MSENELRAIAQDIVDAIKVRREHHIACGADLCYTAGLYEAIRIVQEFAEAQEGSQP